VHQPRNYPALTGIRAVAALLVFLHHYGPDVPALQHPWLLALLGQCHVGVTLFFVLSGFLIADRYWSVGLGALPAFLLRRAGRIMPLYLLITAVVFVHPWWAQEGAGGFPLALFLANATLLRGWFDDLWNTGIAQGWSLTAEMTFYCLALPLLWCVRRNPYALLVVPGFLIATGLILVEALDGQAPYGFLGSRLFFFGITFPGRCIEFLAGVALAWAMREPAWDVVPRKATLIGAVLCCGLVCISAALRTDYTDPFGVVLLSACLPMGLAILFAGLMRERSWLRRVLESGPFQVMGRASYAFYLIHMGLLFQLIDRHSPSLIVTWLVLQMLAWLLFLVIEDPCNRWFKRRFPVGAA
jgi:peptidoglycan/LPS O-acetylase OafA/YrhL